MEFFASFAQGFHVEVTVGFDPVLVDLDGERPNEPRLLPGFYAAPQHSICAKEIEAALRVSAALFWLTTL